MPRRRTAPEGFPNLTGVKPTGINPQMLQAINYYEANGFSSKRQALLLAGYSDNSASAPSHVFGRWDVQAEVAKRKAKREAALDIDRAWFIAELRAIAEQNPGNTIATLRANDYDLDQLTDQELQGIVGWKEKLSYARNANGQPDLEIDYEMQPRGGALKRAKRKPVEEMTERERNMTQVVDLIEAREIELKLAPQSDRLSALRMIGQAEGYLKDALEISGSIDLGQHIARKRAELAARKSDK